MNNKALALGLGVVALGVVGVAGGGVGITIIVCGVGVMGSMLQARCTKLECPLLDI